MNLARTYSITSLTVIGILAVVLNFQLARSIQQNMVYTAREEMAHYVGSMLAGRFGPADLETPKTDPGEYDRMAKALSPLTRLDDLALVKLYNLDRRIVWSDRRELIGASFEGNPELEKAFKGAVEVQIITPIKAENQFKKEFRYLLSTYIPVTGDKGDLVGVIEVYRSVDELFQRIRRAQLTAAATTFAGAIFLYLTSYRLFRKTSNTIQTQTKDLEESHRALDESYLDTIRALASAIDAKDEYTRGHSTRVALIAMQIGMFMGFRGDRLNELEKAALLHDIGKIAVGDHVLKKPSKLTPEEFDEMRRHPGAGARILSEVRSLKSIVPFVKYHHERIDGMGYPEGLAGASIPLEARIIAVADAYDAMRSTRSYRPARSSSFALEELKANAGSQFCPEVVQAFLQVHRTVEGALTALLPDNQAPSGADDAETA